jgi:hypothetical protein
MPTVLALPVLYEAVVARFAAESTVCAQSFGWLEQPRLATVTARITWMPGDFGGNLGPIEAPKQPGRNPRPLATLAELCTVDVFAFDPSAPTVELAQYTATRLLFDAWYRAVYLAARGTFAVQSSEWVRPKSGRPHGACIRAILRLDSMIPDIAHAVAPLDSDIDLVVSLLDRDENLTIPEAT